MINKETIEYKVAKYYVPGYSGAYAVSILGLGADDSVVVKPYSFEGDKKPFTIPLEHVYSQEAHAVKGRRAWETYMKKRKQAQKEKKKAKKNDAERTITTPGA